MSVTEKMNPAWDRLQRELKELDGVEVFIGFQRGAKPRKSEDGDEPDNVDIAAWNEFGVPSMHIPERPFLRQTFEKNADALRMHVQSARDILEGGVTAKKFLNGIGTLVVGLVQEEIESGGFAKNADITIEGGWMHNPKNGKMFHVEGKKSDRPLVDTGQLAESVHYVIRKKGSGGS